jgi:succinate-semialdehyde dehydrogenase/glutarate-semialdehyde dehydrogenase
MTDTTIKAYNPATEELIKEFQIIGDAELEEKVRLAERTFHEFRKTSVHQRSKWMENVNKLLVQNAAKYGETITKETGKTLKQGKSEPEKCAKWAKWYAENAADLLKDKTVNTDSGKTCVVYEPLGILLQIAPFNYPFLQSIRFLTACLMAGNVALIRPSHSTILSGLLLESVFKEAGFPEGAVQILIVSKEQVSKLISDVRIKGVTITGSVKAGKAVAKQAGDNLKKHVMELGGSDAYIICEDADLNQVVPKCVKGRLVNNGQSCTSAKRFIVNEKIYDEFCDKLVDHMKKIKMGDPMQADTQLGPLARSDLRDSVHKSVQQSVKEGAKLILGGTIPDMKGYYYPATVLKDVTPDNIACKDEIFGPVATVIKARNDDHAIELCNMSRFGLGGGVFSKNVAKAESIARKMEVGLAFVNQIVTSSPEYPFGGTKDSGYGKECGPEGFYEWVNIKSLVVSK